MEAPEYAYTGRRLGCQLGESHGRIHVPLFMDEHNKVEGLTAEAVAGAHQKDMEVQAKHGVKYLKYWFNEGAGKVYCLVDAPSKEAAETVHREAHGLVADEIVEVKEGA
jgi:hypothetical protein